jgi:hypothetical protein
MLRLNLLPEAVSTIDEGSTDPAGGDARQGRLFADRRRQTFRSSLWKADRGVLVVWPAGYFGRRRRGVETGGFAPLFLPAFMTDKCSYRAEDCRGGEGTIRQIACKIRRSITAPSGGINN